MRELIDDWANAVWAGVAVGVIWLFIWTFWNVLFAMWSVAHAESGIASVYSSHEYHSHRTASGERMIDSALTAAHKRYPLGSRVLVRHGSRSVIVRINDRGPFVRGRIIDLSPAAAREIGISGLGRVDISLLN